MPVFLVPDRSWPTYGIGICDRCKMKMPHYQMVMDPNSPGLRVHPDCRDQFDPWRLPAIQPERVSLEFPRPDSDIAVQP